MFVFVFCLVCFGFCVGVWCVLSLVLFIFAVVIVVVVVVVVVVAVECVV